MRPGIRDAEFSGASIPQAAAVLVVGRVALVGEVALHASTAGWDMGQPTYIDVDQSRYNEWPGRQYAQASCVKQSAARRRTRVGFAIYVIIRASDRQRDCFNFRSGQYHLLKLGNAD